MLVLPGCCKNIIVNIDHFQINSHFYVFTGLSGLLVEDTAGTIGRDKPEN